MQRLDHLCCCDDRCVARNGRACDSQHKCYICKHPLHAICGIERRDSKGSVVEDISFPRICFTCGERKLPAVANNENKKKEGKNMNKKKMAKLTFPKKKVVKKANNNKTNAVATASRSSIIEELSSSSSSTDSEDIMEAEVVKDDRNSKDDTSNAGSSAEEDTDDIFTAEERNRYQPGFIEVIDRDAVIINNSDKCEQKGKVWKNRMVQIPADYWGDVDEEYWKEDSYCDEIRVLSKAVISKKVILYGKIEKKRQRQADVVLMSNNDQSAIVYV
jgi:hypothetical protein